MNFTKEFFDSIITNQCFDSTAIKDDEIMLTYRELKQCVLHRIQIMQALGLQSDDGVIFMRPDSSQWLIDFFATIYLGGRVILLPWNCSPARVTHTAHITSATWLSYDSDVDYTVPEGILTFDKHTSPSASIPDPVDVDHDHKSLWLSSSGTSGNMPKSVMHRHSSMRQSIDILKNTYGNDPGKVVFSTAKLSFQYGLFNVLYGLFSGYKIVLTKHVPSPNRIMSTTQADKVTHLFSTPTVLSSLVRSTLDPAGLSTVEVLVSGGEHLSDDLEARLFKKYSKTVLNSIGMSEVIICVIGNTPDDNMSGTLGKPWKGIKIKVVDELENEVGIGAIGELMIKSPTCAIGYFDDYVATANAFKDGWYKTNDLVQKLEHGRIRYVGRKNDCDKINGLFVSPVDVENMILNHDSVKECMVSIVIGPQHRKILVANIVLTESSKGLTVGDLRQFLSNHLDPHMIPKIMKIVEDIPTTFTTKKIRSKIIVDHKDLEFI
jgi:acyl-coenzyme A synthetase/AMP-(fatty) acid ligase